MIGLIHLSTLNQRLPEKYWNIFPLLMTEYKK
ncbi:hypothetical protein BN439_3505 [Erwinia amylovora Ea644]|nr:hypothetical protein BN439_3505 [Erwinia amylovora Ea644]